MLSLAGVEPSVRRGTALAVARCLAPRTGPAALFLFQNGSADAHVLGEPAWGRLGPQACLASADMGASAARLAARCDQVGLAVLDGTDAVPPALAPAVGRAVFVARPDAESLVETYREVKAWHSRAGPCGEGVSHADAAVFVVGSDGGREVGWLHDRLNKTAQRFLDCEVGVQGFLGPGRESSGVEPLRLFADAPSASVWSALASAVGREPCSPPTFSRPACGARAVPADASGDEPAATVSLWHPQDRAALLAAVEAQVPALVGARCRAVIRVEVDEPDAPPLAAVCDDGALVAVLVPESPETVDIGAAERWLAAHRSLLARAYPSAGIRVEAAPSALVLAPAEPTAGPGVRRFLPVRLGGRQGVVILP